MVRFLKLAIPVLCLLLGALRAGAEGRTFVLAVDPALEDAGIVGFMLPRFALKYGIRPTLQASPEGADAAILPDAAAQTFVDNLPGATGRPAFYIDDGDPVPSWSVVMVPGGAGEENARRFADWLTGEIGQRTVASFVPESGPVFLPGALPVEAPPPPPVEGDRDEGERLAHFHCGRCHVVSEKNRMGGIGSTPSFAALRAIPDWQSKFLAFWSANPHPSFTQVDGVTEPFDPARPPHIAPVEITLEDIDAITAYAGTIAAKDLGAAIESR